MGLVRGLLAAAGLIESRRNERNRQVVITTTQNPDGTTTTTAMPLPTTVISSSSQRPVPLVQVQSTSTALTPKAIRRLHRAERRANRLLARAGLPTTNTTVTTSTNGTVVNVAAVPAPPQPSTIIYTTTPVVNAPPQPQTTRSCRHSRVGTATRLRKGQSCSGCSPSAPPGTTIIASAAPNAPYTYVPVASSSTNPVYIPVGNIIATNPSSGSSANTAQSQQQRLVATPVVSYQQQLMSQYERGNDVNQLSNSMGRLSVGDRRSMPPAAAHGEEPLPAYAP
ncbi:hypothetical protein HDU76_005119 [Blyttiomyces sp. JEL0837]|nr:hypothetical protein HDU76_005119 [Blyttiomyces sp. JEL0837]